jgi:hypothetical protein
VDGVRLEEEPADRPGGGAGTGPEPVTTVSGVVTDDAGRPLAEVAVAFAGAPVPVPEIAVLTGPDGRFVLAAPAAGTYTVAVNAPGHAGQTVELQVEPGGAHEVEVQISVQPPDPRPAGATEEQP